MPAFSPKSTSHHHVRSISLPARSHPSTLRIEDKLNQLKTFQAPSSPKVEIIHSSLSGLRELYKCIGELLDSLMTQQALSRHQHEEWVNELLEESVRYIDMCSNTRDTILLKKEDLQQLQSALRRRKVTNTSMEVDINAYLRSGKKMKKEVSKSLAKLKENKFGAASPSKFDHHLSAVVGVLREANLVTNSIFQTLLCFISAPIAKPIRINKWSLVSKLVHREAGRAQQNNPYELEKLQIELGNLLFHCSQENGASERIRSVDGRLEELNSSIECLERGLECLFRDMIHTRVSLLNILSLGLVQQPF
ncbi:hypothetical protein NMG60_11007776 [Bertholletia excelsa]